VLFFVFFFLSASTTSAQVVINEFSSSDSNDWVELYALEKTDISGWILDDEGTKTNIRVIPANTIIDTDIKTIYLIDSDFVKDRLNNSGDIITLYKSDGMTIVDQISYGNKGGVCSPNMGESAGRYPDSNATIERFKSPTKEFSKCERILKKVQKHVVYFRSPTP